MPKIRTGKTARKRANGATARNADNKRARAEWGNSGARRDSKTFPSATCNGRKNRSVIVIKKNGKRAK